MIVRSIIFYSILSFWTILLGLLCIPFLFLPASYLRNPVRIWIKGIFFLLNLICQITHEIQGKENIPKKATLVASKHQSAFETFALFYYLPNSIFIHKKQLFWIPIFGQYLKKINMIAIDRKGGISTVRNMLSETKAKIKLGYSIIIFPEGTRKKPGDAPEYKSGFIGIYKNINTEILPVALNTGQFWPKNIFIKQSGHIIIKFLPLLKNNIEKKKILKDLESIIEKETNNLI